MEDNTPIAAEPRPAQRRRKPSVIEILGEILVTVGAVMLLFGFYEAYWTNLQAARNQAEVEAQLTDLWDEGTNTNPGGDDLVNRRQFHAPELGEAFARMYIPKFGADWQFAIVEGTEDADLLKGPGRYVTSQMPGEAGNFAIAGHRVGKGAPFNDLGNLQACDTVVVETRTDWEIYKVLPVSADGKPRAEEAAACLNEHQVEEVTAGKYQDLDGRYITTPGNFGVTYAVPNVEQAPAEDDESLLTMTTCHPQFSNKERMIIHAMLTRTEPKVPGQRPAEMEAK
ncbi:class E sortase [Corynebacterium choanae]|uniref:Sortase family protein n=1 Tax=Corynebacterium choanae TaxID=1862358 RepID=A0A3G6J3B6_9CORY|nr:class E sortase [Corynebacterium choanae]AZA12507.1 Sortase family protein [Corynebacterium choanae]